MRAVALVFLGFTLAGCVSLAPQQEQRLEEMQRFADRATAVYGKVSIRISVQRSTNLNIGAVYRQGNIFVGLRMLDSPNLQKTIAHELGHYILGHDGVIPMAVSQAEWQRAQERKELDANAKAVEILVRAGGMTEAEAVQAVADALRRSADAQESKNLPLTPGHLPARAELADLLARFPAVVTTTPAASVPSAR